jgi:5-methylcytosine-specific restriction endonuclease McrA
VLHPERHQEQWRRRLASETPEQRAARLAAKRQWARDNVTAEDRRQLYLHHRDAILLRTAEYNRRNREAKRERDRAYYAANREKWAARHRAMTEKERARRKEQNQAYRARKAADGTLRRSQWKKNNPEQARIAARIYASRRRAWVRNTESGEISRKDVEKLHRRFDDICAYCHTAPATDLDHVIPLSRGGKHTIGNLLPACGRCNRSKGAKTVTEWRQSPTCPMVI